MMTNKEHLATLSPADWFDRVEWLYHSYAKLYTDGRAAIMHWLDQPYHAVVPVKSNDSTYYFCPVCFSPYFNHDPVCWKCRTDLCWEDIYENRT